MRVLVIENDKVAGDCLIHGLRQHQYAADWVEDTKAAHMALRANPYELLLLDVGLPDGSGLRLLQQLRQQKNAMPVLVLADKPDTLCAIEALDAGADDYLVKPIDVQELCARIRALRRRVNGCAVPTLKAGPMRLNTVMRTVTLNGEPVNLGPKEFTILQTLMERPGRVLSKAQIEDSLYGWGMEVESNAVEVHIHGIRKKLGKDSIETIRHVGYRVASVAVDSF